MNKFIKTGAVLGAMLWSFSVCAGNIQVEHVWARATAPGQETAMVDLSITSAQDAKLIGFSSTACKTAQLHSMTHDNGMMKMREVKVVDLPAGHHVALGAAGYHLMLIGLNAPLKAGEHVPLTLNIIVAGKEIKIETSAEIRPLTAVMPMHM